MGSADPRRSSSVNDRSVDHPESDAPLPTSPARGRSGEEASTYVLLLTVAEARAARTRARLAASTRWYVFVALGGITRSVR